MCLDFIMGCVVEEYVMMKNILQCQGTILKVFDKNVIIAEETSQKNQMK